MPRLRTHRRPTLQQVADAAGVHRSTASRALNPAAATVLTDDVVSRVKEFALKLGYRRDLIASSMRNNQTRLVGILVPDLANPLFAPILGGAEAVLAAHGYAVLVANAYDGKTEATIALVDDLMARRAEGLILGTASDDDKVLQHCLELGLPTVLVNRGDAKARFSAATPDDFEGMRLSVRHLISLGHTRIAHLAGPQNVSTGRLRFLGFQEEMRRAGLDAGAVLAADAYTRAAGRQTAGELLDHNAGITAIAAANDLLALGAYEALKARHLSCPGDVSVSGHNDMALVDLVQPPLTTVRILHDQIGREGARLLLAQLNAPEAPVTQLMTAPELIIRTSTRAI